MNNLRNIIGSAPSELPTNILIQNVRKERERVRIAINYWSKGVGSRKAPMARETTLSLAEIKLVAKKTNQSVEELQKLFADELKKREEK